MKASGSLATGQGARCFALEVPALVVVGGDDAPGRNVLSKGKAEGFAVGLVDGVALLPYTCTCMCWRSGRSTPQLPFSWKLNQAVPKTASRASAATMVRSSTDSSAPAERSRRLWTWSFGVATR
jgi:hypothetical protein